MDALKMDHLSHISFLRLYLFSRLGTTKQSTEQRKTETHIISSVCQEYHQNEEETHECTHRIHFSGLKTVSLQVQSLFDIFLSAQCAFASNVDH